MTPPIDPEAAAELEESNRKSTSDTSDLAEVAMDVLEAGADLGLDALASAASAAASVAGEVASVIGEGAAVVVGAVASLLDGL